MKNYIENELLSEINSILKKIRSPIDSLNHRINKLETIQNNSNSNIITDLHNQISNVINKLDQFNDKVNNSPTSFAGLILIIVVVTSIIFGLHFWDVPAQTNAITQYIYEKIFLEQSRNL